MITTAHKLTRRLADLYERRLTKSLLILLVLVCSSLQLVLLHNIGPNTAPGYSSDDIAQQTIIAQWQQGYREPAGVGDDNWFIKYPLYWVTNQIPVSPDTRAFATSWVLVMTTLVSTILILWAMARRLKPTTPILRLVSTLLPIVAMIGLAPLTLQTLAIINTRNIEVPLFLLLIYGMFIVDDLRMRTKRHYLWALGAATVFALLIADDPIFRYMGILPFGVVLAARALRPKQPLRPLVQFGGIALTALAGSIVIKHIVTFVLPLYLLVHPAHVTTIEDFYVHQRILFSQDLALFNANFWAQPRNMTLTFAVVNLFLLVIGLAAAVRLIRYARTTATANVTPLFLGILPFWIVVLVLIANFNAEARYLILLPFLLIICLLYAANRNLISQRLAAVVVVGFALVAANNTVVATNALAHDHTNHANAEERAVVKVLQEHHLTKGFATYWHANIVSYTSDQKIYVIGITCNAGQTAALNPILSEPGGLKKNASDTFVLYYPYSIGGQAECTELAITQRFGTPDETLGVPTKSGAKIAVYHHDISGKLRP